MRRFFGRLPTIEEWSQTHANKVTPDDIIAAAIIRSFAKNFEDWEGSRNIVGNAREAYAVSRYINGHSVVTLDNPKTKIKIVRQVEREQHYDSADKYRYGLTFVNDIELSDKAAQVMLRAYRKMRDRVDALKEAARQAEHNMKRNEAAWDLAERLLGMTRTESGALVPKEDAKCSRLTA